MNGGALDFSSAGAGKPDLGLPNTYTPSVGVPVYNGPTMGRGGGGVKCTGKQCRPMQCAMRYAIMPFIQGSRGVDFRPNLVGSRSPSPIFF